MTNLKGREDIGLVFSLFVLIIDFSIAIIICW
jgi:hypothetical protein